MSTAVKDVLAIAERISSKNDKDGPKGASVKDVVTTIDRSINQKTGIFFGNIQKGYESEIKFDTLGADLKAVGESVNKIWGGWQSKETMEKNKFQVENMYSRLKTFQAYNDEFGDGSVDISELVNSYKTILDGWDKRTTLYGGFKNADTYDAAVKKSKLSDKFEGLTYDEVQAELEKYKPDSDEYKFLSTYTRYTDLEDFDKAIKNYVPTEGENELSTIKAERDAYQKEYKEKGGYIPSASHYNRPAYSQIDDYHEYQEKMAEYDKRIKELEGSGYLDELETQKNLYELKYGVYDDYKDVESNADFEEGSKYIISGNKISEYINGDETKRSQMLNDHYAPKWMPYTNANEVAFTPPSIYAKYSLDELEEREIKLYNYLAYEDEKNGTNKAQEYLDGMQTALNKRSTDKLAEDITKEIDNSVGASVAYSLLSIPMNIAGGIASGADYLTGNTNPYSTNKLGSNMASTIRSEVGANIEEGTEGFELFGQNIPSFLYQTGMSMGDTALGGAALGPAYSVVAGSSAFQQKHKELIEAGENEDVALKGALASGTAEVIFEYISLDKLLKINGVDGIKKGIKSAAKQAGIEASEEFFTELANIITDEQIRGESSELNLYRKNLKERGYTDKEIENKVNAKICSQLGWAAAGGFASGGGMGAGASVKSYLDNRSIGKSIQANNRTGDMLDIARLAPEETEAYNLYKEYDQKGITANNIKNAQLGNLYSTLYADTQNIINSKKSTAQQKENAANIQNSLRNIISQKKSNAVTQIPDTALLSEAEAQLLNTPDAELTAEQRAEKQSIIERQQSSGSLDNTQGTAALEAETQAGVTNTPAGNSNIDILTVRRQNKQRRHTTAKEQDFIKKVAKALGVKLEFTDITVEHLRGMGYEIKEGDILPDGYYDRDTKTIHLGFSVYNPLTFVFKHELTHFGEGTVQYERFVKAAKKSRAFKNWLEKKTNSKYTKDLEKLYLQKLGGERGVLNELGVLSEKARADMHCEMIADFVGDCIFTEDTAMLDGMLSDLNYKERNAVIQYILDFLSYLKKKLAGNKDIVFEISRLEDNFNRMLSEAVDTNKESPTENGGDLQFSIKTDIDGNKFVDVTDDILDTKDGESIARTLQKIISSKFKNLIYVNGQKIQINKTTNDEFRRSNAANIYAKISNIAYKDKLRTVSNADEILKSARNWIGEKPNHPRKDDIVEFARADILYRVGKNGYDADVIVATRKNGAAVLYDIVNIYDKQIVEAPVTMASKSSQRRQGTSIKNTLPQNMPTVNSDSTQESKNNSKKNLQFSFALVQDENLISKAEAMESELLAQGNNKEFTQILIWSKYGVIRDSEDKWVYEIDDSEMEFFFLGNAVTNNPEIEELYKLENMKRLSKQKAERYEILHNKYNYAILRSGKLSDFVKHTKLFEKFPQLKEVNFIIWPLKGNARGYYDYETNSIGIDWKLIIEIQAIEAGRKSLDDFPENPYDEVKKVVIHEIQHALQNIEDREPGASDWYWKQRFKKNRKLTKDPYTGKQLTTKEAYLRTKGEVEARIVSARLNLTEKDRRNPVRIPWFDFDGTFSAREPVDITTTPPHSLKFSIPSDSSYMSAVENNDTKQLREMVDNAAVSNGYTERLFHQTGAEFTEFNTDNELAGKYDWELPTGMFLKPSNKDIGLKGKKQMEVFANIKKPLRFKDRAEARKYWSENIKGYSQAVEAVEKIDNEYREIDDDAIMELQSYMRQWRSENPEADKHEIYRDSKYQRLADRESAIMEEWEAKSDKASIKAKKLINNFMAESGYDGIVIEHDADGKNRYTKSYIVFDSAQLKSAAPVTYDNNGDVIPLSQRFNRDKKDIRFSVPSVDSYTEEQYNSWESYELTSEFISKVPYSERHAFLRSLANKTNGMRQGECKNIVIITDKHIYFYEATGYMNGSIVKRSGFTKKASAEIEKWSDYYGSIDTGTTTPYEMAEGYEGGRRRNDWDYASSQNTPSKRRNDEMVESSSESNSIGYTSESDEDFETDEELIPGSLVYTDNGEAFKVNEDGSIETIQFSDHYSEAGLDKPAFSIPSVTDELLDMYESGEITKAEYKKAMDKYWDDVIAEVQDTAWAQQLELIRSGVELKKRVKRQNEQLAKRRSEISHEITAQREERATKQKNIEHIRKTVSRIDKMLRTNSESKHVPEELKEEITKFVSVFVQNDRSPFDKKDLRNIYLTYSDALREASAEESNSSLDEDVLRDIKTLRERLDGKTLRELNYHETLLIRNIVDNFAQIIKWANEVFIAGKEYELDAIGHTAMTELTSKDSKKENRLTRAADDAIVYSNMTPVYFFDKIGGVFKTLFNDIVNAQNKWFRNAENGKTFIRQIKEKYHYSEWADDTFKFTTEKGDEIEITREQAMLLYATAKREYGNEFQKAEHLFRGGVVIEPSAKKLKDVVKKFKASDENGRKRIAEAFSEEVDSRAHRITPDDVLKIKFWLTDEQLSYVDDFVEYLSTDMAVLGNEISMQLYGIRKYNENYYIPYNSAQNFLYSQPGVTNESRLKHQSFTKNTVHGANNPLILSDFSTVCADHINRMCMYNALTMPLENMNKIFNYKTSGENIDTRSIQSEIERVYGKAAVSYIKTFIEDMNGNVRVSNTDKAINRWISKFKKGAVFASASVVVQQPSAIIRAMAYIKPKYFRSTTLKFSERDYQQCVQYAPVAGIKEMGRFDTGVGAATTDWLLQETPHGVKNKVKALFSSDSTYRDDKLSYFAAKADEITWAHIWAAVKAEVADTTDLKAGSQEYFEACGKRFTEVINYTQVYDSTISRSQMMRSKSTGAQMLTAFMSEPTVSLNLLMNAASQAKNGGKEGKRFAAGAVAAFVGSVALNSLLKSLVTAARDDDEEETYFEKYLSALTSNFASDINPLGLIPFVKDIVSIFEGYTVERADMNLFSDLAQSIKYLSSDSKTDYEKFESVLGSLAAFLGLPVKNVLKDGRAVYNLCNDLFVNDKVDRAVNSEVEGYIDELSDNKTYKSLDDEDKEKFEKRITDTVRDVQEAETDKKQRDKFDELYEELRKSQTSYREMRKKMLEEGYTADEITAGVEIARIAYMKSIGIDVGEYLLYKIATNEKHADKDKSGGVDKEERKAAIREMDIDEKVKNYFLNQHK